MISPLTRDVPAVRGDLERLGTSDGTALYDGVSAAVTAAGRDPSARRV